MAGLDDELARFEKEIAAVEAAQPEEGQITTQGTCRNYGRGTHLVLRSMLYTYRVVVIAMAND